jgi:hypothetical protein
MKRGKTPVGISIAEVRKRRQEVEHDGDERGAHLVLEVPPDELPLVLVQRFLVDNRDTLALEGPLDLLVGLVVPLAQYHDDFVQLAEYPARAPTVHGVRLDPGFDHALQGADPDSVELV